MVMGEVTPDQDQDQEVVLAVMVEVKYYCRLLVIALFNRFLRTYSILGGPGACFIRSLANFFFRTSNSLSREQTIGFYESKLEISSKTSTKGFCLNKVF